MLRWILLLMLGLVLLALVAQIIRKRRGMAGTRRPRKASRMPDLANLSIRDVQIDDMISIAGVGDDFEDGFH